MKFYPAKSFRPPAAFTMIEVAICLAIIGVALIGIIGVLPRGMNTQRDNREETIVGQDANLLMELVSNGSRGTNGPVAPDDLTNYVWAVSNYWSSFNGSGVMIGSGIGGYTYTNASFVALTGSAPSPNPYAVLAPLNSGSNILSVLSTPEFTDFNGAPIPTLTEGGISNHVVAYVHALSGLAAEKPPQTNDIMQADAFSYRILCVNAPVALNLPQQWESSLTYYPGDNIYANMRSWQAVQTNTDDPPGTDASWVHNVYLDQLSVGQRELRMRFLWPQLPNGNVGGNVQNFRATIAGQLATNISFSGQLLYFYQPQTFVRQP